MLGHFKHLLHTMYGLKTRKPDLLDCKDEGIVLRSSTKIQFAYFFFPVFSTGLVWLYIAGLPLRSCHTIGALSVQGSAQCVFFPFLVAAGFEPTSLSLGGGCLNCYPIFASQGEAEF